MAHGRSRERVKASNKVRRDMSTSVIIIQSGRPGVLDVYEFIVYLQAESSRQPAAVEAFPLAKINGRYLYRPRYPTPVSLIPMPRLSPTQRQPRGCPLIWAIVAWRLWSRCYRLRRD